MLSLANKLTISTQPIYRFVNKYSIDFDGVDDRIITDGADTVAQPTTYSMWIKSSTTTENFGVFGHGSTNIGAFHLNSNDLYPMLYLGANYWIKWNDNSAQDDGEWHHYVVYLATNLTDSKLYIDGVLQTKNTTLSSGSLNAYTESLTIGSDKQVGGNSFEGQIDEFAVYDRELTQAEITRMYNTYYSPNRVANGNFSQIGNEEVTNGDFSQIGSEEVTNGTFATDSDWIKQTGWTISGGSANYDDAVSTSNVYISNSISLLSVKQYKLTFEVNNTSSTGQILFQASGGGIDNLNSYTEYTTGTHTIYFNVTANRSSLKIFGRDGYGNFSIDNVSVKEVGQDWILGGSGSNIPTIGTNNVAINSVDGNSYIQQSGILTSGKHYKITYDVISASATSNVLKLASSFGMGSIPTSVGTQIVYGTAVTSNLYIERYTNGVNATITNISVKEVGQHWTLGDAFTVSNNELVCDGSQTANSFVTQTVGFIAGRTYRLNYKVSNLTAGQVRINMAYTNGTWVSANGDYTFDMVATSGTLFQIQANNDLAATLDNIVVQELKHDATNLMLNAGDYQSANPLITSTKSMEFDGVDDYLEVGDVGTQKSMSFWFNPDNDITPSSSQQRMFGFSTTYYGISTGGSTGSLTGETLTVLPDGASRTATTKEFDANRWYHIVIAWNETASYFDIYVDGVLSTDLNTGTHTLANWTNFRIGHANDTTQEFDGKITETGVWDRTLNALEVASLYNQGMPTDLLVNRNNYQSGNPTVFNTKQVDFDGTDDYMIANSTLGSFTGTVSMWVKRDTNTTVDFLIEFRGLGGTGVGYVYTDVNDQVLISSGTVYVDGVASTTIGVGEWHHVVVTGITLNITESVLFGRQYPGAHYLDGDMSQVGLWNSTLTADEVSSLYNHGLPIDLTTDQAAYESSSNLVGYWRMGSGTLDTYPLIADQTNATLGSDLVLNGNFATDLSNWQTSSWWVWNTLGAYHPATNLHKPLYQETFVVGKTYIITFDLNVVQGGAKFSIGTNTGSTTQVIASNLQSGSYSYTVTALQTNIIFNRNNAGSNNEYYVDNVTVKQVNGNPAIMTNQTSSDIENGSPYANVIRNTDFINGDNWSVTRGNWAISGGTLNTTLETDYCNTTIEDYSSKTMRVKFDIVSNTQGSVAFRIFGSSYQVGTSRSGVGTYTEDIVFQAGHNGDVGFIGNNFTGAIDNVTVEEVNTGLQGYWKMGDGTNDEYPVIYDQVDPTLGSELVTNGDFSDGTNNWTNQLSANFSVTNGLATIESTGVNSLIYQNISPSSVTAILKIEIDVVSFTGNNLKVVFGGSTTSINQLGISTYYTSPNRSNSKMDITPLNGETIVIRSISVKEVQGNSAYMTNMVEGNITNQYPLTKIRNYYRMGDGILDGYPIIQDQTSPNLAHIPTTNTITYSEDFSEWTIDGNASITSNATTSPIGTSNATKLIAGSSSGRQAIKLSNASVGDLAVSIFAKKGEYSVIQLTDARSGTAFVNFDLQNGLVGSSDVMTGKITPLENDWYRCSATYNSALDVLAFRISIAESSTSTRLQNFAGNGTDGLYIWGCQLEEQSQATAYIKSDGIAAVRKSSTTNLLPYSEDFSQWGTSQGTLTANYGISPDGTQNSTRYVFSGADQQLRESVTTSASSTGSIYVKGTSGETIKFGVQASESLFTLNGEWQRIQKQGTTTSNRIVINTYSGATARDIQIWGAQLEDQTQAETYAKTTGLPVTIDLFTENNYGTMTNMSASDIVEDTP